MNNCKVEPIHGEPMLRDSMKDVRELSLVADMVSDKTVKDTLTLAIKRILERDFGVDFDRKETVTVDVSVVGADAVKNHLDEALQEINSKSLNALRKRLD